MADGVEEEDGEWRLREERLCSVELEGLSSVLVFLGLLVPYAAECYLRLQDRLACTK